MKIDHELLLTILSRLDELEAKINAIHKALPRPRVEPLLPHLHYGTNRL
jgi:hypothetical protein